MTLDIHTFPCLKDNYGFLVRDRQSGLVAVIDAPDAPRIMEEVEATGWGKPDYLLNTHWHPDHAGGNAELKALYGLQIYGPDEVRKRAPLDVELEPGAVFELGATRFEVISLKGHTLGQIGYLDREGGHAFIGDCLFALGCGRLFEGTAEEMWQSLLDLTHLPPETILYCAHEYTLANLVFTESLPEAASGALSQRAEQIRALRAEGKPTIPMRLSDELATNPFLVLPLRETGFEAQARRFAQVRAAKDAFTA